MSGGGNKKIWLMNELHAHYETKGSFEALLVRRSVMVTQEKLLLYRDKLHVASDFGKIYFV